MERGKDSSVRIYCINMLTATGEIFLSYYVLFFSEWTPTDRLTIIYVFVF